MKICNECQNVVLNFYMFRAKVKRSQESVLKFTLPSSNCAQISTNCDVNEGSIVLHALDIVKQFIAKYSVESILEDENEQRLIIKRYDSSLKTVKQETEDFDQEVSIVDEAADETFDREISGIYEDESNDPIDEFDGECENENHEDTIVVNNVEFVKRTPDYLLKAYTPSERQSRPKDPDNWIRNKQRTARSKGHAYVTNSGKVVKQKRMQSPCKVTCRFKCRSKISEDDRQKNFDKYWGLGSFIFQRKFIFEHHKTVPIQRRRFRSASGGKGRQYSSQYFLDKFNADGNSELVQVCESMFLRTFDICRNIVAYLHKKVQTGRVQDLRGTNRRQLTAGHETAIEQILKNPFYHIEPTPMPITKMFQKYQEDCARKGITPVKNHTYRKLFAEYNECEFLKLEKSSCKICDCHYRAGTDEKAASFAEYNEHIQNDEKCMQRAKGRIRTARNVLKRKTLSGQQFDLAEADEMIVEEHLNYEDEIDQ